MTDIDCVCHTHRETELFGIAVKKDILALVLIIL